MSSLRSILVLSVIFMLLGTVALVKEAEGAEKAIAIDTFPLIKGFIAKDSDAKTSYIDIAASYEQVWIPNFSLGVNIDAYKIKYDSIGALYLAGAGEFRHYPLSKGFDKFFMGAILGINRFTVDGKTKNGGFTSLFTALKVGYKIVFTGKSIYAEPSMSYVLSKVGDPSVIPLGWQGGLRIGYLF